MSPAEHCQDLLSYLDVRNLWEVPDATYKRDILRALNGAAQDVYALSGYTSKQTRGAILRAPTGVSLSTVTAYGTDITFASGQNQTWMSGCAILVSGDTGFNQLNDVSSISSSLTRPYTGTSGSTTATVYGDCVQLDSDITAIVPGSVRLVDGPRLAMASNLPHLIASGSPLFSGDYGHEYRHRNNIIMRRELAMPCAYLVDNDVTSSRVALRLRVSTLPDREYALAFEARIGPPKVREHPGSGTAPASERWVTFVEGQTNSPTQTIPLPAQWDELYLLPIARKRLMASPYFKNESVVSEILDQYKEAKAALQRMRPNKARTRLVPRY